MTRYGEVAAGHIWGDRARDACDVIIACLAASNGCSDISESVSEPSPREAEDPDHIERRETAMRVRQEARFA